MNIIHSVTNSIYNYFIPKDESNFQYAWKALASLRATPLKFPQSRQCQLLKYIFSQYEMFFLMLSQKADYTTLAKGFDLIQKSHPHLTAYFKTIGFYSQTIDDSTYQNKIEPIVQAVFLDSIQKLEKQIKSVERSAELEAEGDEAAAKNNFELACSKYQESVRLARITIVWDLSKFSRTIRPPNNELVMNRVLICTEEIRIRHKLNQTKLKIPIAEAIPKELDQKMLSEQADTIMSQMQELVKGFRGWTCDTYECIREEYQNLLKEYEKARSFSAEELDSFVQRCTTVHWKCQRTLLNFFMENQLYRCAPSMERINKFLDLKEWTPFEKERARLKQKYNKLLGKYASLLDIKKRTAG